MKKQFFVSSPKHLVLPDKRGFYGNFGGEFIPEILRPNLDELTQIFYRCLRDKTFWQAFQRELTEFSGRPTPVTFAKNLSDYLGGAKIF